MSDSVKKQHQTRNVGHWKAELRTIKRHPYLPDGTQLGHERFIHSYISTPNNVLIIVEDPLAPKRGEFFQHKAEVAAANAARKPDEPTQPEPATPPHFRETLISFNMVGSTNMMETMLDYMGPPWSTTGPKINTILPMMGKPTGGITHKLRIEGWTFVIGNDWNVRVGAVFAAGDQFKGVVMEVEYLPVEILPNIEGSSPFLDAFFLSLLPDLESDAIFNSVVLSDQEWDAISGKDSAGLNLPSPDDIYVYGDEEADAVEPPSGGDWRRSAYMIVQSLHQEGVM